MRLPLLHQGPATGQQPRTTPSDRGPGTVGPSAPSPPIARDQCWTLLGHCAEGCQRSGATCGSGATPHRPKRRAERHRSRRRGPPGNHNDRRMAPATSAEAVRRGRDQAGGRATVAIPLRGRLRRDLNDQPWAQLTTTPGSRVCSPTCSPGRGARQRPDARLSVLTTRSCAATAVTHWDRYRGGNVLKHFSFFREGHHLPVLLRRRPRRVGGSQDQGRLRERLDRSGERTREHLVPVDPRQATLVDRMPAATTPGDSPWTRLPRRWRIERRRRRAGDGREPPARMRGGDARPVASAHAEPRSGSDRASSSRQSARGAGPRMDRRLGLTADARQAVRRGGPGSAPGTSSPLLRPGPAISASRSSPRFTGRARARHDGARRAARVLQTVLGVPAEVVGATRDRREARGRRLAPL